MPLHLEDSKPFEKDSGNVWLHAKNGQFPYLWLCPKYWTVSTISGKAVGNFLLCPKKWGDSNLRGKALGNSQLNPEKRAAI